jgi:hypothetical protein
MSASTVSAQPIDSNIFQKENIRFEPCQWSTFGPEKTPYGRSNMKYALMTVDNTPVKVLDGKITMISGKPATKLNGEPATMEDVKTTIVPLVIKGCPMSTYGVSDNKDGKTQEITGHSVCLNLPKGGSTFETAVLAVHRASCEYLAQNAEQCGLNPEKIKTPEAADMILECPAKHPKNKDTKKIEYNKPKRMYAKLCEYKASETRPGKMLTIFDDATSYNPETRKMENQVDPLTVRSNVEMIPSISMDSIYFGSKPSIQVKLPRAAITRALENNVVEAIHEDVGMYMASLGLTAGGAGGSEAPEAGTQDPATML